MCSLRELCGRLRALCVFRFSSRPSRPFAPLAVKSFFSLPFSFVPSLVSFVSLVVKFLPLHLLRPATRNSVLGTTYPQLLPPNPIQKLIPTPQLIPPRLWSRLQMHHHPPIVVSIFRPPL